MKPSINDAQVVLKQFDESDWDELRIDIADFHLHVYKSPPIERPGSRSPEHQPPQGILPDPVDSSAPSISETKTVSENQSQTKTKPTASDEIVVRAPSLGTFYRAPNPGAEPFVEIGDEVDTNTQLCLLEVMKLYTPVEANQRGILAQILVEDGELVEHEQALFVITPHGE